MGYLVEVVSGTTVDVFLKDAVFDPLSMHDTGFHVPSGKVERFAALYTFDEEGVLKIKESPTESKLATPQIRFNCGGGLVSTIEDFVRFCGMLLGNGMFDGKQLLSRKSVELMTLNHIPESLLPLRIGPYCLEGIGYGLGVSALVDVAASGRLGSVGSYGWMGSSSTEFWIDPKERLIGLIMQQFEPSFYHPTAAIFRTLAYQAIDD